MSDTQIQSQRARVRSTLKLFASLAAAFTQGGVRVITDGREEGREVARLRSGQFFGETGIVNDEPRTASVRAIGEARCLVFEKESLLEMLADDPKIMRSVGLVGVERAGKLVDAKDRQ